MTDTVLPTHEAILRLCAATAPNPWYPRVYAHESGVSRDGLDPPMNELRVTGFIQLTDWTNDRGQGYVLTDFGEEALKNPVALAQFRAAKLSSLPRSEEVAEPDARPAQPTRFERGEQARSAFLNPEPPRVMPVLLVVNLIAFGISLYVAIRHGVPIGQFASQGDATAVHAVGALHSLDLIHGEWWRLISYCFLHFGLIHLLLNMYALYALGQLESFWGWPRYVLIYFVSGLGGSCVAMLYDPGPPNGGQVLAGASGAIWGLMISGAVWIFANRSHFTPQSLSQFYPRFGMLLLINIGVSFLPGVSAAAHFGGGGIGFILATLLLVHRVAPPPRRVAAIVLIAMLPVLCIAAVREAIEKDPRWQRIAEAEKQRLQFNAGVHFKNETMPAIDKADIAFDSLQTSAYILMDEVPEKRKFDKVRNIREEIKNARELVKIAEAKLADKPAGDDNLNAAYAAGKDYMLMLGELLDSIDRRLDKQEQWTTDERPGIERNRKKSRMAWLEARNRL